MERNAFLALLALAATSVTIVSNPSLAMNQNEFFAAEARGEFASPQAKQRAKRAEQLQKLQQQRQERQERQAQLQQQSDERTQRRSRIEVPTQTQQVAVTQMSPLAGINLGGSWLAANMGSTRPAGAPGAWCGYAMRMEMVSQGFGDPGPEFNQVSHWCRVGSPAPVGAVGSIFVSRGHVSKVVAGDCPQGTVATISGNATARRVSHMCEPISRAVCSRWPGKVNS